MSERDWDMLTDFRLGDPLADIPEFILPPYSDADIEKWEDLQ